MSDISYDQGMPLTNRVAVGLTAVQLISAETIRADTGIQVVAPSSNTGYIFVGQTGVTATTGLLLEPGSSVLVPTRFPSRIYVISDASAQYAYYMVI